MSVVQVPGIYLEEVVSRPPAELRTGVPAFLGFVHPDDPTVKNATPRFNTPRVVTLWPRVEQIFGPLPLDGYLGYALRGFLQNGGSLCYVVGLDPSVDREAALLAGLKSLEPLDAVDLVCAPDVMLPVPGGVVRPDQILRMQRALLEHCSRLADRFAILDAWPSSLGGVLDQRRALQSSNAALYYPWIKIQDGPSTPGGLVPPCGHVAGVYAESDREFGVHKAPANVALEGVLDLEDDLTDAQQAALPKGINCLRAFPGRGIRVWGAQTLSDDPDWTYVGVRRLFLTAARWIERNLADATFEPNDATLWARITRDLSAYFTGLLRQGALKGNTAQEAFYVKCDAETNPVSVRDAGLVVTEIGLAPVLPGELIRVHIVNSPGGVSIAAPA